MSQIKSEQHHNSTEKMLSTRDLAAALSIGREAARRLMESTPGVITLPTINGNGKNLCRRMPRKVFDAFINRQSAKAGKGKKQ